MESSNTQLQAHTSPAIEETALHPKCSSTSSPNSPLDNQNDDDKSTSSSTTSSSSSPSHNKDEPLSEAATKAPSNQEMERGTSSYRIPSSVFARRDSSTPMEWSVASNESLFSIHMGTMSFANDQMFWRSGELACPAAEASTSDHMFSYADNERGGGVVADMRSRELGLAEATMKEVIKESEKEKAIAAAATARNCHRSRGSDASTKSFAFSLMGGEAEKGCCSMRIPSSVKSSQEQAQTLKAEQSQSSSTKANSDQVKTTLEPQPQSSWFSCFYCCSCISR